MTFIAGWIAFTISKIRIYLRFYVHDTLQFIKTKFLNKNTKASCGLNDSY